MINPLTAIIVPIIQRRMSTFEEMISFFNSAISLLVARKSRFYSNLASTYEVMALACSSPIFSFKLRKVAFQLPAYSNLTKKSTQEKPEWIRIHQEYPD